MFLRSPIWRSRPHGREKDAGKGCRIGTESTATTQTVEREENGTDEEVHSHVILLLAIDCIVEGELKLYEALSVELDHQ